MDEMKVKLSNGLLTGIVAKMISMTIRKKYGCKVDVRINDLDIDIIDGETTITANVGAKLDKGEFMKIVKTFGMD